jgi:hypothetical protein
MIITRKWAMPNKNTFTIKPIRVLIEKYIGVFGQLSKVIVDPFANTSRYGTITNDINPEMPTDFHLDALEFLQKLDTASADMVLYDPPFSLNQAIKCYKSYGKDKFNVGNMQYWARCKDEIARIIKPSGVVICCGWNTNGLGKNRNFEMLEILIVHHGGSKNDTLVTVELKI